MDRSTAEAFGAQVQISVRDRGLFLVLGRGKSPVAAVRAAGAQMVYEMPGDLALLAAMSVTASMALRRHRDIAHVGPVTIDAARFQQFVARARLHASNAK